ncbi:MAG: Asp-tRNA(Asn)/Glu-tRNA(Gln) amidotransferase subunit GatA [Fimbriimonadaceae bacterium]|jgi:aspartyl-tRNA(Asn)/glutamyl-tRNA(Gln) amidotransferase subunit A|nr:Asp-tRNA(Asn)/Glu-tRNA(Gln) amidotransferase subunit GatA [Fimbriimonadaceae bacterium]
MITQLTATEINTALRAKKVSVKEVTEAFLKRIENFDEEYGAYLALCPERALAEAEAAQAKIDAGDSGPLVGVPIAHKDNISTQGVETTCASKILQGYVPPYDATVVENCREAGMVLLGKTNLDEFAMGTSGENSALRLTRNPWDTDRVPGGSSAGSAAAVSAELACLATGSDTGGSIRMPASLTGLVGFKPTYGRVSRYGLVAFGSSLDQIGPFAKTVEDCSLFAEAMSGYDRKDSTSLQGSKISSADLKTGSLKGKKIALPRELFTDAIDPGVRESVEIAIDVLTREGVDFHEITLPSINYGVTTYYIIAPAEASSNLAKFDGVRFGSRVESTGHVEGFAATRGKLFGPEVKLRIMVGTYALSAGYYDAYYHRAQQVRGLMAAEFEQAFQEYDCILSPASPVTAFKIGEMVDDPMKLKLLDLCTIPANMGGFPSLSLPSSLAGDLPVGILLTGPVMGDEKLLQTAYNIDRALGRDYRRPPIL